MEKYDGNQKGFIYVSCDAKDQKEAFERYLEPVAAEGVSFCWGDTFDKKEDNNISRSNAVLLFLTKDFAKEDRLRRTIEAAVKHDKPILSVYLEDVELDPGLSMQIESQQAMFVSGYKSDDDFVDELKKAAIFDKIEVTEQQKKKQKSRVLAAVAAALAAAVVLAIAIKPMLTPAVDVFGLGLSKKELASVEEIRIVGTEILDVNTQDEMNADENADESEDENYRVFARHDEDNADQIIVSRIDPYNETIATAAQGDIADLAGIEQMKNLKVLVLDYQQIDDITPILELKNLEYLSLSGNPISSLDGIEKLPNLRILDISNTNVREFPEGLHLKELYATETSLSALPDFNGEEDVILYVKDHSLVDASNLSTAKSYDQICMDPGANDIQPAEFVRYLKGIPVRSFAVSSFNVESLKDASGLTVTEDLAIDNSDIESLDGIEQFDGLEWLDVRQCENLTDLTPVNELKSLKGITISPDMEDLSDAVDTWIRVEIYD